VVRSEFGWRPDRSHSALVPIAGNLRAVAAGGVHMTPLESLTRCSSSWRCAIRPEMWMAE